jgi:hypothetical protein
LEDKMGGKPRLNIVPSLVFVNRIYQTAQGKKGYPSQKITSMQYQSANYFPHFPSVFTSRGSYAYTL